MEKYKIDFVNDKNRNFSRIKSPMKPLKGTRTLELIDKDFGLGKQDDALDVASLENIFKVKAKDTRDEADPWMPKPDSPSGRHASSRIMKRTHVREEALMNSYNAETTVAWEERVPNARLGSDTPAFHNQHLLGSSQLSTGCQGDFCDFLLDTISNKETVTSNDVAEVGKLSAFRSKMLTADSGETMLDPESQVGRLMKKEKLKTRPRTREDGPIVYSAEVIKLTKINFKSIMQSRAEMPLVKVELERHRRGKKGDYLSQDDYREMATAGKVPSHYYREVPCCMNCFKVYNIVDAARSKALMKITKEIDAKKKRLEKPPPPEVTDWNSQLTNYQVEQLQRLSENSSRRSNQGNHSNASSSSSSNQSLGGSHGSSYQDEEESLTMQAAIHAVEVLTKSDVSEIRSMVNPPAAVEVVMEAVMIMLTGKSLSWKELHRFLAGGEAFLTMLQEFDVSKVSPNRLEMVGSYVDNPLFRPETVAKVSLCASKFCAWVHGVVHAVRYRSGRSHPRIDPLGSRQRNMHRGDNRSHGSALTADSSVVSGNTLPTPTKRSTPKEELSFVQKLEKYKGFSENHKAPYAISRQLEPGTGASSQLAKRRGPTLQALVRQEDHPLNSSSVATLTTAGSSRKSKFDPYGNPSEEFFAPGAGYANGPASPSREGTPARDRDRGSVSGQSAGTRATGISKRENKAMRLMQQKTNDRLANPTSGSAGAANVVGNFKVVTCADGITQMPYVCLGKFSFNVKRCSFIVIHDFFDTADATSIAFKPIAARHEGCQIMCFNYPGQAHTVWPRASEKDKKRGVIDPVLNNDWIADRVHEMLVQAEANADILLSCPFHLVGIGNGAAIAAAFAQRWGSHAQYKNSLRSLVTVNGFLYPDPQLSAILHASHQIFEAAPHSRPDIPIAYWSKFLFSEEYLTRVNPNLALNILTAVSNPITNEGRKRLTKGSLNHRDLRGQLAPDFVSVPDLQGRVYEPLQVPIIVLQSTENTLVNASNVDGFITGRLCKHLWSHMLNVIDEGSTHRALDPSGQWVGQFSNGPEDYAQWSTLGRNGLKMLLETLRNPRGVFTMWTRTGHQVQQESRAALMDLMDVLACPTDEYVGLVDDMASQPDAWKQNLQIEPDDEMSRLKAKRVAPKVDVIFKLEPPRKKVGGVGITDDNGSVTLSSLGEDKGTLLSPSLLTYDDLSATIEPRGWKNEGTSRNTPSTDGTAVTHLTAPAQPGDTRLEVASIEGFLEHMQLQIGANNIEFRELVGFGSILLDRPLEWYQPTGAPVMGFYKGGSVGDSTFDDQTMQEIIPGGLLEEPSMLTVDDSYNQELLQDSEELQGGGSAANTPTVMVSALSFVSFGASQIDDGPGTVGTMESSVTCLPEDPLSELLENRDLNGKMKSSVSFSKQLERVGSWASVDDSELTSVAGSTVPKTKPYPSLKPVAATAAQILFPSTQGAAPTNTSSMRSTKPLEELTVPEDKTDRSKEVVEKLIGGQVMEHDSVGSQREVGSWAPTVPNLDEAMALEIELVKKQQEYFALEAKLKALRQSEEVDRMQRVDEAQSDRRNKFMAEDQALLDKLQKELDIRQQERDYAERQRRLEVQLLQESLVNKGFLAADTNADTSGRTVSEDVVTYLSAPAKAGETRLQVESTEGFLEDMELQIGAGSKLEFRRIAGFGSIIIDRPLENDQPKGTAVVGSVQPRDPVKEMPPIRYEHPENLPKQFIEGNDVVTKLDRMLQDEEDARKRGGMTASQFDKVKSDMQRRQLERDQKMRKMSKADLDRTYNVSALVIQTRARGVLGRERYQRFALQREQRNREAHKALELQRVFRGMRGRRKYKKVRDLYLENVRGFFSATTIQRVFRGYLSRRHAIKLRKLRAAVNIQRAFRGMLGRFAVQRERDRLERLRLKQLAAMKIQSLWRMKVTREEFRGLRIHVLAATELQRIYRGHLGRKNAARRRNWDKAQPGAERIELGLKMIEDSKIAFARQQEEMDALHRAQERAEARVSSIHSELKESEKELLSLERELQEIDQIERDLSTLTHERHMLDQGIEDAAGAPNIAKQGHKELVIGQESTAVTDPMADRRRKAEAYALEMTIQIKRAEREKKRQELEMEFAAVFKEVDHKRKALVKIENAMADMEATRDRKEREFKRLQKNLMQLLVEQKEELDNLREKGIELETATATTAAAAIATANKAKQHEKQSKVMFSQTEELMKFQFMSMSLSYFSSLNMLKGLRDMNADTTSAAVAMSADAAAAAAGAAATANLPNIKKTKLGAEDFVAAAVKKKRAEVERSELAEQELETVASYRLPEQVRSWSIQDVSRWLDSLSMGQYIERFAEASVDGPFLMELREEDMVQVLNMKHKLHVRKLIVSREKLTPLTQQQLFMKSVVEREEVADGNRKEIGVPQMDMVFSQARNGRMKRVEDSLNEGFKIDAEDERGNTLLIIACQNANKRLAEMLLIRGANVNHVNAQGNSPLHFAFAFDAEGTLPEYLIEHGADDSIENIDGLTPYDGLTN